MFRWTSAVKPQRRAHQTCKLCRVFCSNGQMCFYFGVVATVFCCCLANNARRLSLLSDHKSSKADKGWCPVAGGRMTRPRSTSQNAVVPSAMKQSFFPPMCGSATWRSVSPSIDRRCTSDRASFTHFVPCFRARPLALRRSFHVCNISLNERCDAEDDNTAH